MTPSRFPLPGTLHTNPNITPSFKKGDYVILLKDCIDPQDPEGHTRFLLKDEIFMIDECGYSEYVLSSPKCNSENQVVQRSMPIRILNNVEWCLIDFETDFVTGTIVKAKNCRLATQEDFDNDEA